MFTQKKLSFNGPSKIIYSPNKPLGCGARVWIETESEITIIGESKTPKEIAQCNIEK